MEQAKEKSAPVSFLVEHLFDCRFVYLQGQNFKI